MHKWVDADTCLVTLTLSPGLDPQRAPSYTRCPNEHSSGLAPQAGTGEAEVVGLTFKGSN